MEQKTSTISFCKLGWHRPLFGHEQLFRDMISGKPVYKAKCSCGREHMVDSTGGYSGFTFETKASKKARGK